MEAGMDGDDEVAVPMVTRSGVERATAPDNRFPHDEISLDNFSVNRMLLVFKQLEKLVAVKEQQLEAKEKDAKMWQNFSTFKDQLLRDQGDELKTTQHQLEYHRELVKVLQSQLDENKQSMSATNSDDGSDGIFVHRSKGELEVKNNELETKIQKLNMQNRRLEREDVAKHTMSSNEGTEGAGSRSHVETQKDAGSDMPTERADLEDHGGHTSDDLYNLPYLSSSSDDEQPDNPDEAVSVYSVSSSDEEKSIDAYEPELPMSTSARRNDTVEDLKPQTSKTGRKSEEAADQKVKPGDIAKYTLSEDAGSGSASASASRNDTFEDSKPQTGNIGHKSAAVTGKTDAGGASSSNVESEYLRLFPHGTKNPPKLGMGQTLACNGGPDSCLSCAMENMECLTIPQYFGGEPDATVALHNYVESILPAVQNNGFYPGDYDARQKADDHRFMMAMAVRATTRDDVFVPVKSLKRKQDFD